MEGWKKTKTKDKIQGKYKLEISKFKPVESELFQS